MQTKNVLITGAEGGIGKALCKVFSRAGYRVIATDKHSRTDVECVQFLKFDILQYVKDSTYRKKILLK